MPRPLTPEDLTTELRGALVRYDGGFEPEYGLVTEALPETLEVRVNYHLGSTSAKTYAKDLTLIVPALDPTTLATQPAPELSAETYNEVMDYLLKTGETHALQLADDVRRQIGASAQRRAGR
jgi:hypothetical protein